MKKYKAKLFYVVLPLLLVSCHKSEKGSLVQLQIVDRNGFTKTVTDGEDMRKYEVSDLRGPSHHEKVVRVYDKEGAGVITLYHDNGVLWQFLETKAHRAHGSYEEYFSNGNIKIKALVSEGVADLTDEAKTSWVFDKESLVFDEEGNRVALLNYEKGVLQGEASYFYADGNVKTKIPYSHGKICGKKKGYDNNGDLILLVNYLEGLREGEAFFKGTKEEGAYEEVYRNDRVVYGKYFDLDGKVFSEIESGSGIKPIFADGYLLRSEAYQRGEREGTITLFRKDRTIESRFEMIDDKKHGEEILYFPAKLGAEPIKKLLVTWKEGVIHGKVSSWYPNGVLECEKDMSDHKKEGTLLAWYMDSSLMMVEEYQKGKLINGKYLRKGDNVPISRVIDGMGDAHIYDKNGILLRKISYYNGLPIE